MCHLLPLNASFLFPPSPGPEIMCWYFAGMGGFWGLGLALGIGSRGFASLFCKDYTKIKKSWNICFKWRKYFFLNYQRGINSWTQTDLSVKCDEAENWNHWSSGARQRKGCKLTLVSCSLLCSSQNLFYFLFAGKKNFCARFWDCRPGDRKSVV